MIQIVTGKLGAGKTLLTVMLMFDALCKGRTVVTNIKVNWPDMVQLARRLRRVELEERQLIRLDPGMDRNWQRSIPFGTAGGFVEVFLDEIHLFFNARDWSATTKDCAGLLSFLTQSRKARVNITFIAQEESTIDKQFRVQAEWILYAVNSSHMPLGFLGTLPIKFFIVCKRDSQNGVLLGREYKAYDKRYFKLYDSFSFLDDEMSELSENAVRVEPLKLRRVSLWRWSVEPFLPAARMVRAWFCGVFEYFKPEKSKCES